MKIFVLFSISAEKSRCQLSAQTVKPPPPHTRSLKDAKGARRIFS